MSKRYAKRNKKQKSSKDSPSALGLLGRQWRVPPVATSAGPIQITQEIEDIVPASAEWVTVSPTISSAGHDAPAGEVLEESTAPITASDSNPPITLTDSVPSGALPESQPIATSPNDPSDSQDDAAAANDAMQLDTTPSEPDSTTMEVEQETTSSIPADTTLTGSTLDANSAHDMDLDDMPPTADPAPSTVDTTARDIPPSPPVSPILDIVAAIPGMYRILDLVNETSSNGLVDKVIIDQASLGQFVNAICPGAYQSMTHVNFKALDDLSIRPLGIYGSKSEIVRYLQDLDLINDGTAKILVTGRDDMPATKALRAGLYLLHNIPADVVYVIFWPQDTTWDDDAMSAVARNRVTFMRYLTKIADQIVALVPDDYSDLLILGDQLPPETTAFDFDDGADRLYTFEVQKTREEEENVTATDGFKISTLSVVPPNVPDSVKVPPEQLLPRLVPGETCSGLMTISYQNATTVHSPKSEDFFHHRLTEFIKKGTYALSPELSESAFKILVKYGMPTFAQDEYSRLQEQRKTLADAQAKEEAEVSVTLDNTIQEQHPLLVDALFSDAAEIVSRTFSILNVDALRREECNTIEHDEAAESLQQLMALYPGIRKFHRDMLSDPKLTTIEMKAFSTQKDKLLKLQLHQNDPSAASPDDPAGDSDSEGWTKVVTKRAKNTLSKFVPAPVFKAVQSFSSQNAPRDTDFLQTLPEFANASPELAEEVQVAVGIAQKHFASHVWNLVNRTTKKIEDHQREECKKQLKARHKYARDATENCSRSEFIARTRNNFVRDPDRVFIIKDIRDMSYTLSSQEHFCISGIAQSKSEAMLRHTISLLQVTAADNHTMQLVEKHVPSPRLATATHTFDLPLSQQIVFIQLLPDERCFLITRNGDQGDVSVYLDRLVELDASVKLSRTKKVLKADKLHGDLLFSFDETKRMFAICHVEKLQIRAFVFDEHHRNLVGLGEVIDLSHWYDQGVLLKGMIFRCGSEEELLLLDSGSRARILSLTTQQIRPASLQLSCTPGALRSSPDGSCFFSVEVLSDRTNLQAYHWASFGSSQGISIELPAITIDSLEIITFANRTRCHVVVYDISAAIIRSRALQISHKSTEFTFRAHDRDVPMATQEKTAHNVILDCHRDVWTRFPVVPAVCRHTFKTSERTRRSLTFVSSLPSELFLAYYTEMVDSFERATRKPVEDELANVAVSGISYPGFMKQRVQALSQLKAGEWLVDILCLIPIHIAVARDNRFVPLKDGVWSADFERGLLGATVEQVVDKLSFGWYESIFQSYMAAKPVRVVSSMGEQSVGKSFALNHLADTSFAGSAMRTTEGVWMSVTPTDDCLIVALDFEGVHSIERSAQEDSLLVLFNTAISNLVLFRNNYALSRDIAGLFQSFQSSATVLDPAANPSLFRSELVIIIKDVVDSDKRDITREFSTKFQQIVQDEQEGNFISRLHRGRLSIIPWPVIESRQFYTLFTLVKNRLDKQPISHDKAGIFLQMMKTLMAKLKTNDWGALDQNLAMHRATHLQAMLVVALQFGASELGPEREPLKDIDNGVCLALPNGTPVTFYLPAADGSEDAAASDQCLDSLRRSWDQFSSRDEIADRDWIEGLDRYLDNCAKARIEDVHYWLDANIARFNSDTTTFQALRRQFEALSVALRAGVQLCKLQCADCQLYCVQSRHHAGGHNCETSHRCSHACAYPDEHPAETPGCGLPAGHSGQHICDIARHLCGAPCHLSGKEGCLGCCAKIVNHAEEEHMCPAKAHGCGMPCGLKDVRLTDGSLFSCTEPCHISSEVPHDVHVCQRQSCPLFCQLCRRLCSESNHLHGLEDGAVHLCGQEHDCTALCQSAGICRIETAPQSVEATFTGRHETFQYTKYMQESKRLPCVVSIPPGSLEHCGSHQHSLDPKAFHFCETRCNNCGYFCTLPLGHSQKEHDTSHGSMSRTNWAIEDGSVVEVNGRKFGSNDDGAPLLCSMICQQMGRHAHIDYCRAAGAATCGGNGVQHCSARMVPEPRRAKDFITHKLHWKRTGFKDPYSHEDRESFAKCDAMLSQKCAALAPIHQTNQQYSLAKVYLDYKGCSQA